MDNIFKYHIIMSDYDQPEDLQHLINAYNKIGFQCMNVKWVNNKPEFNIIAKIDTSVINKMLKNLSQLINEACANNDFSEVIQPFKLKEILQMFDIKNQTHLFDKYAEHIQQLEAKIISTRST